MARFFQIILLFAALLFSAATIGQVTRVRGVVFDQGTGEPLPFVNVAFKGTTIGSTTGFDGAFFLETRTPVDSLIASYLGYKPYLRKINKGAYHEFKIYLESDNITLNEVVVKAGENPAHKYLRGIIENKDKNDPDRIEAYKYEIYNKMELDVNNITDEYKNKKAFKHFQFIFDYVDTSAVTGKTFLPVFIVETLSDFYYQKNPLKKKEVIKANNVSGVENESFSEFTGQMYLDFNIYSNQLPIMGQNLVSPIARFGLLYYKYYLIDSAYRNNTWCYNISFKPKRKQEPTFTGNFWVADTTFAIQSYKIQMAEDMNINWIKSFIAEQSYEKVGDSIWFPLKQELFIDFAITNKEYGFFGRKTTSYANIELDPTFEEDFFSGQLREELVKLDSASELNIQAWDTLRHEKLSEQEKDIYAMVDSIQEVPLYQSIVTLVNTFITGYWTKGPVEIGPYYTLYSFNPVEGNRFRIGAQTSNEVSTTVQFGGHIAYGTKDKGFKYGLRTLYIFKKDPRRAAFISYKDDYEQLGISNYAFLSDNILSSLLARKQNDKLTKVSDTKIYYEHEWFQGVSNTLTFNNKFIYPSEFVPFTYIQENNNTVDYSYMATTEFKLNTRIAYNEKFLLGEFNRISLGTKFPIVNINLTAGVKNLFNGEFEYYKVDVNLEDKIRVNPFGTLKFNIDAGKIFGNPPFPFLQLHEGNQTYAFDDYAFNLMNYYEFVSDTYASLNIENHFMGTFLNHVPLFRKLKWREIVGFKMVYGTVDRPTVNYVDFPVTLNELETPYMEAGVGIENIFKFFRIDAVWRLTHLDNPDAMPFGMFAKMQLRF